MRCPNCTAVGASHTVTQGVEVKTLLSIPVFWDPADTLHVHDPNTYTVPMTCSNGHAWDLITETTPCPDPNCTWTGPHPAQSVGTPSSTGTVIQA